LRRPAFSAVSVGIPDLVSALVAEGHFNLSYDTSALNVPQSTFMSMIA
jgi:hypothetical protein